MINDSHLKKLCEAISDIRNNASGGEDPVWEALLKASTSLLNCEAGTVFEADEKRKIISVRKSLGKFAQLISNLSFGYQGICGWCAQERKSVISNDVRNDTRFTSKVDMATGFITKEVLCVPLMNGGELFGVLELINPASGKFSEEDLELAGFISYEASAIVRLMRLEETIKKLTLQGENVLHNLSGGFIGADLNGNVMFFNPRARQILGLGDDNYVGKPLDSMPDICQPAVEAILATLRTGNALRRQEFNCSVNGADRRIGYSTLLIQDVNGKVAGAGITFQDITGTT